MEKLTFDETTQLVDLIEKLKEEACDENKENVQIVRWKSLMNMANQFVRVK